MKNKWRWKISHYYPFKPERTVKLRRMEGKKGDERWEVRYHLEDPRRLTVVVEKWTVPVVVRMVRLLNGAGELLPEAEIAYATMFPRHVDRCCDKDGNMTENDIVSLGSVRRDMDRDVIEMLKDDTRKLESWNGWICWDWTRTRQSSK
jgi:hypothetical protein